MIKAGIIGGAGYTAGELIRILLLHPKVEIDFVYSTSNAGNKIFHIHQDLLGVTDLSFSRKVNPDVEVVFLCLGHGNSKKFLEENTFSKHTKIIDLSNDFRLNDNNALGGYQFVYGLTEAFKDSVIQAQAIANPGCFATAIQLALLPLSQAHLLENDVHISAVTGATGAGTQLSSTTHFCWRDNNFSYYKPFVHQHLDEINQTIKKFQADFNDELVFVPHRGNFSRGIFVSAYLDFYSELNNAQVIYKEFYQESIFVSLSETPIHLKQVVNTNKAIIHLHKHKNRLLVSCCIDNLLKGASGQAVQNMNLMFGYEEITGLQFKANYF